MVEPALRFFPQRAAGRELRLLLQVRQPSRWVQLDRAGIGRLQPGEDLQQRRLAGAVGSDQADPFLGADFERDPGQDRLGTIVL